jgi:hypothetical protein
LSKADVNQHSEKLDGSLKEVAHLIHSRDRVCVVHFADHRAKAGKLRTNDDRRQHASRVALIDFAC